MVEVSQHSQVLFSHPGGAQIPDINFCGEKVINGTQYICQKGTEMLDERNSIRLGNPVGLSRNTVLLRSCVATGSYVRLVLIPKQK